MMERLAHPPSDQLRISLGADIIVKTTPIETRQPTTPLMTSYRVDFTVAKHAQAGFRSLKAQYAADVLELTQVLAITE